MQDFKYITNLIHTENPYTNFNHQDYNLDLQGWVANPEFLQNIVKNRKPKLIIEVGTFKGKSSILMAEVLKSLNQENTGIICIDTWLGGRDCYTTPNEKIPGWWMKNKKPDEYRKEHSALLNIKNGYPQIYYQFLANVKHKELEDYITPFPQTSAIAARWLKSHQIKADLIYVDASHDYEDVIQDLNQYFELLQDNGILFGDDYWIDDVKAAAQKFAQENNLKLHHDNINFFFEK
jgi:predicted O-methyltransferase YrrM